MRTKKLHTILLLLFALMLGQAARSQGRIVINEYMPWTLNGCGATSEFVELLNFGPGPMDIGGYVLTDGDFAVTIPLNTIVPAGGYYVISGQSIINAPCANIDSTIHAQLNWNTCGCTSGPIPTTGDGFFTDGGSANEQVVLLDRRRRVVDAVIRSLPAEPSSPITAYTSDGTTFIFNLDQMNIDYEVLGMSAGRGNSFARKLDGDCGWVKDPQQSANATNNTPSVTSDISYDFSYVNTMDCNAARGSIQVYVRTSNYATYFPMSYTLAYDVNGDGQFGLDDQYSTDRDSTAPDIYLTGLAAGHYRITVESRLGCSLKSFEFKILSCLPVLPVQLIYFRSTASPAYQLEWLLNDRSEFGNLVLERSAPGGKFTTEKIFLPFEGGGRSVFRLRPGTEHDHFRLKMIRSDGSFVYSPIVMAPGAASNGVKAWPNPARDQVSLRLPSADARQLPYRIYSLKGEIVAQGVFSLTQGVNTVVIPVATLPLGLYQLAAQGEQPICIRFVKS